MRNLLFLVVSVSSHQLWCDEGFACHGAGGSHMFLDKWGRCHSKCIPHFLRGIFRGKLHWQCGTCPDTTSPVQHIGSTAAFRHDGQDLLARFPSRMQANDLLLLSLSRTDDVLPIALDGWTTGPVCFKTDNRQERCHTVEDCVLQNGDYCKIFGPANETGLDLATAMFYRTATEADVGNIGEVYNLNCVEDSSCHGAWAIMMGFRGADNENPIGDSATISYDMIRETKFPSVNGTAGDKLVLSMAFDDGAETGVYEQFFRAPEGMERLVHVIAEDEAGFAYAQNIEVDGPTGEKVTTGPGASPNKDAAISMVIRQRPAMNITMSRRQ